MSIQENIRKLKAEIPGHVAIIAVSKRKPVEDIMQAYKAGHRIFGENRVQELIEKQPLLPGDINWHMIGHLQTNKVKYIMYLGRLTGNKRLDVLIKAFPLVQQSHPQIFLYIIGSGSELNRLKLLAQSLNIDDKVCFLGVKSGEKKIKLIRD